MILQRRRRRDNRPPPGASPSALLPVPDAHPTRLHLVAYDTDRVVEQQSADLAEIAQRAEGLANVWIDVAGLGDLDTLRAIGGRYGLHPLSLEDIVQVVQRPKVETYEGYLFIVLRLPRIEQGVTTEQLVIVLGDGYLITFSERPSEYFDAVRHRLTRHASPMQGRGVDYVAYALIDALIDSFFPILEHYGEVIDELEQEIVTGAGGNAVSRIHNLRRDIMDLRRAIWPLRDLLKTLTHDGTPHIEPATHVFLRDCGDHVFQLLDMLEIHREVTSTLFDLQLSVLSTRMNEIMKVLTIIATIFIPLGFIASLYGMNFDRSVSPYNMPELGWRYGYPYALLVMTSIALGLLGYFWAKGWIGKRRGAGKGGTGSGG
jgi:magnesium transporter